MPRFLPAFLALALARPALAQPAAPPAPDPFPASPRLDAPSPKKLLARAEEAYAGRDFAAAAKLFADAKAAGAPADAEFDAHWGYCRLVAAAERVNKGAVADPKALEREVEEAAALGGDKLKGFADAIRKNLGPAARPKAAPAPPPAPAAPAPAGDWQTLDAGPFRVLHRGGKPADEVGRVAAAARDAMFKRWAGAAAADWSPKCDIYLHPTGADYAKATGKSAESPGHATVGLKGGAVSTRRIDLRADAPDLLDAVLPREVTYLVLSDMFSDQPLPRWAEVGMETRTESPEQFARYLRTAAKLGRERKLPSAGKLLVSTDFPDPADITGFYAASVSLVDYLVRLKDAKAFAIFLREAPRRGFDKVLQTHYGIRDAADLQDRWAKSLVEKE